VKVVSVANAGAGGRGSAVRAASLRKAFAKALVFHHQVARRPPGRLQWSGRLGAVEIEVSTVHTRRTLFGQRFRRAIHLVSPGQADATVVK
jgi:hypothetical protein